MCALQACRAWVWIFKTQVKGNYATHTPVTPATGRQQKKTHGTCWPVSIFKPGNSRFKERSCLKGQGSEQLKIYSTNSGLEYMHPHICVHTQTYTLTHTQKNEQKYNKNIKTSTKFIHRHINLQKFPSTLFTCICECAYIILKYKHKINPQEISKNKQIL